MINKRYNWNFRFVFFLATFVLFHCMETTQAIAQDKGNRCMWVFERYEPSSWEIEWLEGEESGERQDRECDVLATPVEVDRSVRLISAIQGAMLRGKRYHRIQSNFSPAWYTSRYAEKHKRILVSDGCSSSSPLSA